MKNGHRKGVTISDGSEVSHKMDLVHWVDKVAPQSRGFFKTPKEHEETRRAIRAYPNKNHCPI